MAMPLDASMQKAYCVGFVAGPLPLEGMLSLADQVDRRRADNIPIRTGVCPLVGLHYIERYSH